MNNRKVFRTVGQIVDGAVNWAVFQTAYQTAYWVVHDAVYWPMDRATTGAVNRAMYDAAGDSPSPSLRDFQRFAEVGET